MKTNSKVRAFSLIELSIVILIIGILIAGVTQGSRILSQAKLNNARTTTKSAPVSSIKNLALWIESTSEESITDAAAEDGQEVLTWYDLNPQTALKADFSATTGATAPHYKTNVINGLPAIQFDGGDFMSSSTFQNIVTRSSTVFMVVKTPSTLATKTILSKRPDAAYGSSRPNIQVGLTSGGKWQYCDSNGIATSADTCNFQSSATGFAINTPYVVSIVFVADSASGGGTKTSTGYNFFENGVGQGYGLTTSGSGLGEPNTSVTESLFLGKHGATTATYFTGHVGEIIIFDRNLKKEERQSIEAYLGKKWGVAMTTAAY
jgi:prepilin-type N-terminal cleavage/methylation domain-containing protein